MRGADGQECASQVSKMVLSGQVLDLPPCCQFGQMGEQFRRD